MAPEGWEEATRSHQRLAARRRRSVHRRGMPPGIRPMPLDPYHVSAFKPAAAPSEPADRHIVPELLQAENDRLRRENATLKSALKAASSIVAPYAGNSTRDGGARGISLQTGGGERDATPARAPRPGVPRRAGA